MEKQGKRIGRPTRTPKPGERMTLGLRLTAELKTRLDETAAKSGRSLSQEAELRLERSFDRQDLLTEVLSLAYGRDVAGLLLAAVPVMDAMGRQASFYRTGRSEGWTDDPVAYDLAVQALNELLDKARPAGDATIKDLEPKAVAPFKGGSAAIEAHLSKAPASAARAMAQLLSGEKTTGTFKDEAARAREAGGSAIERLQARKGKDNG